MHETSNPAASSSVVLRSAMCSIFGFTGPVNNSPIPARRLLEMIPSDTREKRSRIFTKHAEVCQFGAPGRHVRCADESGGLLYPKDVIELVIRLVPFFRESGFGTGCAMQKPPIIMMRARRIWSAGCCAGRTVGATKKCVPCPNSVSAMQRRS